MSLGDVFTMTTWTHVQPHSRITFKCTNKREVAVMLLLGHEPKDGSAPLDLEAAIGALGWVRKTPKEPTP
jgi:hypothetical protein